MAGASGTPPREIQEENKDLEWSHSKESLLPGPGAESKQESRSGCSSFAGGMENPSGKQIPED